MHFELAAGSDLVKNAYELLQPALHWYNFAHLQLEG